MNHQKAFSFFFFILNLLLLISGTKASIGDYSIPFQSCLSDCVRSNCTSDSINEFQSRQALHMRLLQWDCVDECKYECMWYTVELFEEAEENVPQFYGKWPFLRILGIQEPLSTLASLLHLIVTYKMIKLMIDKIDRRCELKWLWIGFAAMNFNTWIWSTIFHTRDTSFTEKMDYFSAFAMVLYQFNAFFIRFFTYNINEEASKRLFSRLISLICIIYYCYHIYYLSLVRFDYGYNMKANVFFGLMNSMCWLVWSVRAYRVERLNYTWKCIVGILLIDVLTLLELTEFQPILWTLDSHALWHLTTISVPFFLFPFYIDDCNYNLKRAYIS